MATAATLLPFAANLIMKPKTPKAPKPMPTQNAAAVQAARKKATLAQTTRSGRLSTILSGGDYERLGS